MCINVIYLISNKSNLSAYVYTYTNMRILLVFTYL